MNKFIPNAFQIPNSIIDDGYLTQLSCNATRCYFFICRKTTGWQKSTDAISLSQFMNHLNIKDKRTVQSALKELIKYDFIYSKKQSGKPTLYTLNTDPKPPTKNVLTSKNVGAKNEGTTPYKNCTPQNTIQKEEEEEDINKFKFNLDFFIKFLVSENNQKIKNPISFKNQLLLNFKNKDKKTHDNFHAYLNSYYYVVNNVVGKYLNDQLVEDYIFENETLFFFFNDKSEKMKIPKSKYLEVIQNAKDIV